MKNPLIRGADRLHAPRTALAVEGPPSLSEEQRDRIADTLRLADRPDADAVTLPGGRHVADGIPAYARDANVNRIVVGKTARA